MLYLAYGSNLNVDQMSLRCPGAVPVGRATIPNHRLVFRGSLSGHYLSVDPDVRESVECIAWQLAPGELEILDRYEGCPYFYTRRYQDLPVRDLDGEKELGVFQCMWYALPETAPLGAPSHLYTRACVEGYRHFGLSEGAIKRALRHSLTPAGAAVAIALGFQDK